MKNLFNLRAVVAMLACLVGLGMSAQTLTPESGKTYRIKNVRSGKYLTMADASSTTLTMASLQNNDYQFWELTESTSIQDNQGRNTWSINNVAWKNAGTNAYLGSTSTSANASVTIGTNFGSRNGRYTFQEATSGGKACYAIVPRNASNGLNCAANGTSVVLYSKDDEGSLWVLEEAAMVYPEIVTLQSARSKKYMYDANGLVKQSTSVGASAKWIKYSYGGGVVFINNSTHKIIQGVAKNSAATTGTDIAVFSVLNNGDNYGFFTVQGKEEVCLNERNGNDICGWTGGLTDAGNNWLVKKVGEISDEEVLSIFNDLLPYAKNIEAGKYYRLYNETRDNYAYNDYIDGHVRGGAFNENDYRQVWKAVQTGAGMRLQSVVSDKYIQAGSGQSVAASTGATGTTFTFSLNSYVSTDLKSYFNIKHSNYSMHMDGSAYMVNWYSGTGSVSASEWLLCSVAVDDEKLAAAKGEYNAFAGKQDEFQEMVGKTSEFEKILNQLFEDKACTTLKESAQAMSEEEFAAAIEGLPQLLQDMCLKVKNNTWTLSKAGNNWEKFFRIADYRVYSSANEICWEIGMSNPFSRLSNPTGISGNEGDVLAVFVDEDCPANASLMAELTDGGEKDNPRTGEQTVLHRGLNLLMLKKNQDLFIYYQINGSGNNPIYYLDKFKDMKIHVEGGVVNGYYDQTRGMNDTQWADMVNSNMLRHGRVFLKGSHVVGNWPSSVLLNNNPKAIDDICTFYNQIPKWEQEIMGVNNNYLPTIEQRYRNVLTALGTDLGSAYMYATSFGTYYNWGTLNDILSRNVLSNGGNQWGPAHEFGHNHQELFNMVGCTEVSNNVFSNAVIYKMGAAMSRGVALSELIPAYAKRQNWMMLGIWCKTQMYWKLYQYFHLAGYDTEFFPKVFSIMRTNGLKHRNGQLVPASTDYLRFAEVCCEAANADLSEFFQMYGFFDPVQNDTEKDGVACQYIDDYSTYYLYSTPDMIENTLNYCHSFEKKILNIGFIDDRIRATPATYPGAPAGTMRTGMNGGGDNSVGTEGTVGMYLDYYPENYVPVTQYNARSVANRTGGKTYIAITKTSGKGAMGFKVYSPSGELMYFYNDYTFTMPDLRSIYGDYDNTNITIMAADAKGNDVEVKNPNKPEDAIVGVSGTERENVIYDLQGRRVNDSAKGVLIVNGKKVVR